jgi:hypothetical protein
MPGGLVEGKAGVVIGPNKNNNEEDIEPKHYEKAGSQKENVADAIINGKALRIETDIRRERRKS